MSERKHWITGIHAVTELLKRRPQEVERLLVQANREDHRISKLLNLATEKAVLVESVSKQVLEEIAPGKHQGVAAQSSRSTGMTEKELPALLQQLNHPPLLLVLDGVTDPHNLGACLRTADAAGVDAVIVPKDKSASLNATVSKVASGAAETVNLVTVTNLSRCLKTLQENNVWLVGTDDSAQNEIYSQDLQGPIAIVMGSEGSGLRRLTRETCDFLVSIPMAGELSSLNVSVATGVALFEAVRQRQGQSH
ncbi:MAG: 23S rRNA (guanosine(2251)-2'-O)-methyltransferase RlmB [Gammaproteobacteria bacterium]